MRGTASYFFFQGGYAYRIRLGDVACFATSHYNSIERLVQQCACYTVRVIHLAYNDMCKVMHTMPFYAYKVIAIIQGDNSSKDSIEATKFSIH